MELNQMTPPLERSRLVVPDRTQPCRAEGILRQQLKRVENCAHRDDCRLAMKSQLIAIVAAVLVVGCGPPKPPDISIREAVKTGNIESVKQHIAAGADVNAKGKYGRTPLHYAASRGLKKIIELLIARGADVNAKIEVGDYKGQTPLDGAIQWNRTETADLLRKHGGKTAKELKAEGK